MQSFIQFNNEVSYLILSIFFDSQFFWHFFIFGIILIYVDRCSDFDSKATCIICGSYVIMAIIYFFSEVGIFSESNFGALILGAFVTSLVIIAMQIFKSRIIIGRFISSLKSGNAIAIKLKGKVKKLFHDAANNEL